MELRSFFKPAGTNPEIEGPYYELSSFALVVGQFNLEALTLGFKKGTSITKMTFRPIDPTKPIVLAVNNISDAGFVYIDHHLEEGAEAGMRNYDTYKTDEFLIDCKRDDVDGNGPSYWSIKSEGLTFVYGEVNFPGTWKIRDADLLCAFVGGELTSNQLQAKAYLAEQEISKEERREEHIERLVGELRKVAADALTAHHDLYHATDRYEKLVCKLELAIDGVFPFIGKAKVLQVIEDNN